MATTSSAPRVLVSGAGIAGLTLALQLVRRGVPVTVVERAASPRPGGQAVDLRGASRHVAELMGLMPEIDARRVHEEGLAYVDADGRVFARMSMADFDGKGAVAEIEIARGDLAQVLMDALRDAADETPGLLELRFGDRITELTQDADGVDAAFESGDRARYGVVVGADGVHSATRRLAFGPEEQFTTGLGGYAAYFTLPTPDDAEPGWFSLRFVAGVTFGIRPDRDPSTSKAMITVRMPADPSLRGDRARQEALIRDLLDGQGWHAPLIAATMSASDDFYFDELVRVDLPSPVNGRVVLIGDAASCGSPMTGMGTATAMIGAYLLAERIAAQPAEVPAALAQYALDIEPFSAQGKQLPGGGIERMVPGGRIEAVMLKVATVVLMSRPLRPLMRRMFASSADELSLPEVAGHAGARIVDADVTARP